MARRAFAKTLDNNGGGGIINIVPVLGVQNFPLASTCSASKAALHSATQALRFELSDQQTLVVGVYPGPVDTDLVVGFQLDKDPPAFSRPGRSGYRRSQRGFQDAPRVAPGLRLACSPHGFHGPTLEKRFAVMRVI